jgi:hypothetical protein
LKRILTGIVLAVVALVAANMTGLKLEGENALLVGGGALVLGMLIGGRDKKVRLRDRDFDARETIYSHQPADLDDED